MRNLLLSLIGGVLITAPVMAHEASIHDPKWMREERLYRKHYHRHGERVPYHDHCHRHKINRRESYSHCHTHPHGGPGKGHHGRKWTHRRYLPYTYDHWYRYEWNLN